MDDTTRAHSRQPVHLRYGVRNAATKIVDGSKRTFKTPSMGFIMSAVTFFLGGELDELEEFLGMRGWVSSEEECLGIVRGGRV